MKWDAKMRRVMPPPAGLSTKKKVTEADGDKRQTAARQRSEVTHTHKKKEATKQFIIASAATEINVTLCVTLRWSLNSMQENMLFVLNQCRAEYGAPALQK